jgi:integrase
MAKLALSSEHTRAETARAMGFMPPGDESFADVADQFLVHQKPRLSAAGYKRECGIVEDHLKPFCAGQLKSIRRATIHRYISMRLEAKAACGTVTKELNVLKHLLRLASEEWEYIPINPARGVKAPKASPGRVRYLQPNELRAVLGKCPEWLRVVVALAVTTGMRRSEILGLRWLDVDLKHNRILLPQTKNGEGRIVYLNKTAELAIRSLRPTAKSTDPVFAAIEGSQVSMHFLRICRRLGIADFRFHDLRHTAASWMRMKGADIHTVAQLLGHKDLRMAARYQHLSPAFLADAVGKLDEAFAEGESAGEECPRNVPVQNILTAATSVTV